MGVSPNGVDAYFSTFETLVPQDRNGAFLKFYDARTGGGFEFSQKAPGCEAADECHDAGSNPPGPAVITSGGSLGSGGNAQIKPHKSKKKAHKKKRKGKKNAHRRAHHG